MITDQNTSSESATNAQPGEGVNATGSGESNVKIYFSSLKSLQYHRNKKIKIFDKKNLQARSSSNLTDLSSSVDFLSRANTENKHIMRLFLFFRFNTLVFLKSSV